MNAVFKAANHGRKTATLLPQLEVFYRKLFGESPSGCPFSDICASVVYVVRREFCDY